MTRQTSSIPISPDGSDLPKELVHPLTIWAQQWAQSSIRPRLKNTARDYWSDLIERWLNDDDMPLFIRRGSQKGQLVTHASGRDVVYTDNTPAIWMFTRAFDANLMAYEDLKEFVLARKFPVAFAFETRLKERATYKETMQDDLNTKGWKLCHIENVGKGTPNLIQGPISNLTSHFQRFLDPRNMFLVPKRWSGLGEIPEVIEAMKEAVNEDDA